MTIANPSAASLFPELCSDSTTERMCYLRDGATSTFVVPGEWVPSADAELLVRTYGRTEMLGVTSDVLHNEVQFFVDGPDTYAAIAEDLEDAMEAGREGFVGHIGWTCYLETPFGAGRTYRTLMQRLVSSRVKTRALYWAGNATGAFLDAGLEADRNALMASAAAINAMTPSGVGKALLDSQTKSSGSHHQKIWVILGRRGLTAYFGGVDVHTNRVLTSASFKDPWHDVHARVRGPAAARFLGIFLWRLMAAIDWRGAAVPAPEANPTPPDDSALAYGEGHAQYAAALERYNHQVDVHSIHQLCQSSLGTHRGGRNPVRVHAGSTIGNPQLESAGFRSEIHYMVHNAIEQARRFIYVEDQYFWHHEMAQHLGNRVREGHIKELVVVTNISEGQAEHPLYTKLGLRHLAYAARGHTDRILVFEREGSHGVYVHSKMFVYDDACAHVGSANFNNRGYSHDSESAGVFVDRVLGQTAWHMVGCSVARKLRARLWEKHLGVPTRHLYDGLGAMKYWHDLYAQNRRMFDTHTVVHDPLVPGAGLATVGMAILDGTPWDEWARNQGGSPPPADVTAGDVTFRGVQHSWDYTETADSTIDPP